MALITIARAPRLVSISAGRRGRAYGRKIHRANQSRAASLNTHSLFLIPGMVYPRV